MEIKEKIKVEKLNDTEYKVSLDIPAAEVDVKFDDFFKSVKKDAQLPGFRKGKASVAQLKAHFGPKARAPVSQVLISDYYKQAVADNEISPIGNPRIEGLEKDAEYLGAFAFDNSFSVEFIIETLPKIDPTGYKDLELALPKIDADQMFKDKMLAHREQFAERSQIMDRGAQLLDAVVIDFKGFIDGEAFEGGEASGFSIDKLGHGNFIPGFEDRIVGTKTGENTDVVVTFPEDYRAKHLAGKEAKFEVKVNSIVESKLAEIDTDLAMMVGFNTVEELNENILKDVEKDKSANIRNIMDQQIMNKVFEANDFGIPESMIFGEIENLKKRVNIQEGMTEETLNSELRKHAEYSVKRALLIDAIYEKEDDANIAPEELSALLEEHASAGNQTKDELVSALYNSGQMDSFVGVLRESKVIDFIIDSAKKESGKENGE